MAERPHFSARAGDGPTPRCSFCGKTANDGVRLVAGPGVFICHECVGLCAEILDAEQAPSQ